jgi:uncharacterized protein YhfF
MEHPPEVHEFWDRVREETGIEGDFQDAWGFGDSPELADELMDLVLSGRKRASCNLLKETEIEGWPATEVDAYNVILDGAGRPRAVIRTVSFVRVPFSDVTEEHAYREGEGDRTLESFRREHIRYYTRVGERLGFEFHEDMEVEMETFELVYPMDERRMLLLWAADCAQRVVKNFERASPDDLRPRRALDAGRAWVRHELGVGKVRDAALAAHAAAREVEDGAAVAAARAAGHAAATAHVVGHARHAAAYAVESVVAASDPDSAGEAAHAERRWQHARLPEDLREVVRG